MPSPKPSLAAWLSDPLGDFSQYMSQLPRCSRGQETCTLKQRRGDSGDGSFVEHSVKMSTWRRKMGEGAGEEKGSRGQGRESS